MIRIDVDGTNLYYPANASAYPVISPTLSVELNKAGSASFTLPPKHPLYGSINKLKSKVTIWDQNSVLWRGRCLNYEDDAAKNRTFLIEGQLAYLNDAIIRPYEFNGTVRGFMAKIINEYNEQVDEWKRISLGAVTVTSPEGETITRKSTGYTSAWDEINSQLVSVLGGYLVPFYHQNGTMTVSYQENPGDLGTQDIRFGKNILDLSRFVSAENIYTVLIPTGKSISETTSTTTTSRSGSNVTIESVNGGLDYIQNNTAVNLFGKIWREKNWSYISSPSELKAVGAADLAKNIAESVTINIDAIDLHVLNVNTQAIKLGSLHNVIAEYYGLNAPFYCSKIDYNFNEPSQNRYTFGTLQQTLTELQRDEEMQTDADISNTSEDINDRIDYTEENLTGEANTRYEDDQAEIGARAAADEELQAEIDALAELIGTDTVPDGMTVLEYAQSKATQLITNGVAGGHVFVTTNEILIMDTTDKATATKVWRWNSGGLGFSDSGYNGTFKTAMTNDGRIVADMITAGKLLAEYIALFGKMAVYKTNVINNNNIGGYIGYFAGDDGSGTTGIAMTPTTGNNKIAVSTGGASLNGGTPLVSVQNKAYSAGPFEVQGGLTVSNGATINGANVSIEKNLSVGGNLYLNLPTSGNSVNVGQQIENIWARLNEVYAKAHTHNS